MLNKQGKASIRTITPQEALEKPLSMIFENMQEVIKREIDQ